MSGSNRPVFGDDGRYVGQRVLGAGGFGEVWEAQDQHTGTTVALKILKRTDPDSLARLKSEFRALSRFHHPNLVERYSLEGESGEAGRVYLTMELIEGQSLVHWVDLHLPTRSSRDLAAAATSTDDSAPTLDAAGEDATLAMDLNELEQLARSPVVPYTPPPPLRIPASHAWASLRDILAQLTEGLHYLHTECKIVHCDVKPGNVMVDPNGVVKILDFGLAWHLEEYENGMLARRPAGTPEYMAPEQFGSAPRTAATDFYAVGCLLHQLMTGQLPFQGSTQDIILRKYRSAPELNPRLLADVPGDLVWLCQALLQRDPAARPDAEKILAVLRQGQVSAGPSVSWTTHGPSEDIPLVGRESELDMILRYAQDARRGKARCVLVTGPSGMGKSRLLSELRHRGQERLGALFLEGRCHEREYIPFKAVDGILNHLVAWLEGLDEPELKELIPADGWLLSRIFSGFEKVLTQAQVAPPAEAITDPQLLRARMFACVRELILRIGRERLVVLVVDDAQWGDRDSASLLTEILSGTGPRHVLLVLASRAAIGEAQCGPMLLPASPLVTLDPITLTLTIPDADDLRSLGAHLARTLPTRRGTALMDKVVSGGVAVPYDLYAVAAWLREQGEGVDTSIDGPTLLKTALTARIARLTPGEREVMEMLAIAERPLRASMAARLAGLGAGEHRRVQVRLLDGQFARALDGALDPMMVCSHDQMREKLLESMPEERRRRHHLDLGNALEADGCDDARRLLHHFLTAGIPHRAYFYAQRSAREAEAKLAFDEAARLYRIMLDLEEDPTARRTLYTRAGEALSLAGRNVEAADAFGRAIDGAAYSEALELDKRRADHLLAAGNVDAGLDAMRSLARRLGVRFPEHRLEIYAQLVFWRLRMALRGTRFKERPASAILQERLTKLDFYRALFVGLSWVEPLRPAIFHSRRYVEALDAGEPMRVAHCFLSEAFVQAMMAGQINDRSTDLLNKARAIAQSHDVTFLKVACQLSEALILLHTGHWLESVPIAAQAAQEFEKMGPAGEWIVGGGGRDRALSALHGALTWIGDFKRMASEFPGVMARWRERGSNYYISLCQPHVTRLHLVAGAPERARAEIKQILALWTQSGYHLQHALHTVARSEIALYCGEDADTLLSLWEEALPRVESSGIARIRFQRLLMRDLVGRCAVGAALRRPGNQAALAMARANLAVLDQDPTDWAQGLAERDKALLLWGEGKVGEAATALRAAGARLTRAGLVVYGHACERVAGEWIGGDEGDSLIRAADGWMADQGITDPERMSAVYVAVPRQRWG